MYMHSCTVKLPSMVTSQQSMDVNPHMTHVTVLLRDPEWHGQLFPMSPIADGRCAESRIPGMPRTPAFVRPCPPRGRACRLRRGRLGPSSG